jgi:hypothetical protein
MDEMENVAANIEEVATPQDTVETTEQVVETEQPIAKPDITETQAFSARLKEQTQKATAMERERQDKFAQRYGYSSFDEMENAEAEREAAEEKARFQEQNGFDPDTVKPLFEQWKKSDPDFQELSSIRAEKNISKALTDLNSELSDCGIDLQLKDLSDAEVAKIPNADKVTQLVQSGKTLAEAVFLANKKEFFAKKEQATQQETIKKITANGASSPGSLSGGGDNIPMSVSQMSTEEFNKIIDRVKRGEKIKL